MADSDAIEALASLPIDPGGGGRSSQRDALIACAHDAELWHDPDGVSYATVQVGTHRETYRIRSSAFRSWLGHRYFIQSHGGVGAQAEEEALRAIEARARFEGPTHRPAVRIAWLDGVLWLDLADDEWRAVRVDGKGWSVVSEPAIRFIRPRGMKPLPIPARGGSLTLLRQFLNAGDDDTYLLLVAFLVGALMPSGPYPVLVLGGEQGSAKSTVARVLRALIDPHEAPIRSAPREEDDLIVAARGGHVVAFDNLSNLPPLLADAICRLSTGAGFGKRQLYTDGEEVIFAGVRPVILNGIPDLATRPDLADRAIVVTLPPIPDDARRSELEFWSAFEAARPAILGALLDAVVVALRRLTDTCLGRSPRMADFARWVVAAEPALPWSQGAFLAAYSGNRAGAIEATLDADPVADAVCALVAGEPWKGRASELMPRLAQGMPEHVLRSHDWPKDATRLSGRLRRLAPALRKVGIDVAFPSRSHGRRVIEIGTSTELSGT
jgi:hypothetical protein